jgi:hypothetical protein
VLPPGQTPGCWLSRVPVYGTVVWLAVQDDRVGLIDRSEVVHLKSTTIRGGLERAARVLAARAPSLDDLASQPVVGRAVAVG